MNIDASILKMEEEIIYKLRELYYKYGYSQYKMSKFEEYDLYARNKDFLISDNIITFTDTNGKLMALRPDVTLSIVRNNREGERAIQKVYYNENVYRVSKNTHAFQEIPQIGVECLGSVGNYDIAEILLLAAFSLKKISDCCKLYISHLDILSDMIDQLNLPKEHYTELISYVEQKNIHEIANLCSENAVSTEAVERLKKLILLNGKESEVIPELEKMGCRKESVDQLKTMMAILKQNGFEKEVSLDFSIVSDLKYYNGIAFKGFVEGIPTSILSGGQYDNLMKKMNKSAKAIGFAVYLDMLERLAEVEDKYDVDVFVLYDSDADPISLCKTVRQMTDLGLRVVAQTSIPDKFRYKQLINFKENRVEAGDNNA